MTISDRWLAGDIDRNVNPETSDDDMRATCKECFGEYFSDSPNDANEPGLYCSRACEIREYEKAMRSMEP